MAKSFEELLVAGGVPPETAKKLTTLPLPAVFGAVCVLVTVLGVAACGARGRQNHDTGFGVTVFVVGEDQAPIQEAIVTLVVAKPVFQAVTPMTVIQKVTDATGVCVFMYIAQKGSVPYAVTVRKDGYGPQTESGVAAPHAHLKVQLARNP